MYEKAERKNYVDPVFIPRGRGLQRLEVSLGCNAWQKWARIAVKDFPRDTRKEEGKEAHVAYPYPSKV